MYRNIIGCRKMIQKIGKISHLPPSMHRRRAHTAGSERKRRIKNCSFKIQQVKLNFVCHCLAQKLKD